MIQQLEITLQPKSRGFHLVTGEIMRQLPKLPKTGIINIFCKHTSCGHLKTTLFTIPVAARYSPRRELFRTAEQSLHP